MRRASECGRALGVCSDGDSSQLLLVVLDLICTPGRSVSRASGMDVELDGVWFRTTCQASENCACVGCASRAVVVVVYREQYHCSEATCCEMQAVGRTERCKTETFVRLG